MYSTNTEILGMYTISTLSKHPSTLAKVLRLKTSYMYFFSARWMRSSKSPERFRNDYNTRIRIPDGVCFCKTSLRAKQIQTRSDQHEFWCQLVPFRWTARYGWHSHCYTKKGEFEHSKREPTWQRFDTCVLR